MIRFKVNNNAFYMQPVKVLIEIRDGALQAVYSNTPLNYVLVDYDNIAVGENPVSAPLPPDAIASELFSLYNEPLPPDVEIREELKRIKF